MTSAGSLIAIDARYVNGHMSGMARYTLNLLHGLESARAAPPLILLTSDPAALPAEVRSSEAFRLLRVPGRPGPRDQWGLARRLESEGVGLLYSLDAWTPMTGAFRRVITIYDLIPLLCRPHLRRSWKARLAVLWKAWLRAQCRRADAVVTVSRSSAEDIGRHLGVPAEKLHVIYPGVRVTGDRADGSAAEAAAGPYALYVGRCDPYKNLPRLMKAFARVRRAHPALRLIIVGPRDPRYPEAEAEALRCGLDGAARFTGQVSDDELRALYRGASLLVMPSLREGFGLPPLEAMGFGVPVVASNVAALTEVCGDAALLVDPLDPAALAAAMVRVLSDAPLAETLRRRGLSRAARFTPGAQAAQTLALCERLLGAPASGRRRNEMPARPSAPVQTPAAHCSWCTAPVCPSGIPALSCRTTVEVLPVRAIGGWQAASKRAMDLSCALVLLAILGLPMLLIALWIRITSGKPVLFRQERVGLGGRCFMMLKFRTMRGDAEEVTGPVWAQPNDPRCTRSGALLRATNLDELPQLFNVLRGEMSLVGPRPERPFFVQRFVLERPLYAQRHAAKGGITGWAQLHGLRGRTCPEARLQHDLHYIRNWSLGLNVRILLRTPFVLIVERYARRIRD